MEYSEGILGFMFFIVLCGFFHVPNVRRAVSHSTLVISIFSKKLYPWDILTCPGDCAFVAIDVVSSSSHLQEITYQKHFFKFNLPPVQNNLRAKSFATCSMCAVHFRTDAWLLVVMLSVFVRRDVSSTYASPIWSIVACIGVSIWKHMYFDARDHIIGSRMATQIDGEAQLPYPIPNICQNALVW